jgi:hypothetical protein
LEVFPRTYGFNPGYQDALLNAKENNIAFTYCQMRCSIFNDFKNNTQVSRTVGDHHAQYRPSFLFGDTNKISSAGRRQ